MTAAQLWRCTLRGALLAARKNRNSTRVSARRELSDAQIRALMHAEIDERLTAAKQIEASHTERAATLRTEAAVLGDLLGDV